MKQTSHKKVIKTIVTLLFPLVGLSLSEVDGASPNEGVEIDRNLLESSEQVANNINTLSSDLAHENHGENEWTKIKDSDTTLLDEGNYFLEDNVDLINNLTISADITLCLNGKILKGNGEGSVITVNSGYKLTICDCQEGNESVSNQVANKTFNSGVITGGDTNYGGGLYLYSNSSVVMDSGAIAGNTASYNGGAIFLTSATFSMNGGTVINNTSTSGESIRLYNNSSFTVKGGFLGDVISNSNSSIYITGGYFSENAYEVISDYILDEYQWLKTNEYTDFPYSIIVPSQHTHDSTNFTEMLSAVGGEVSGNYYLATDIKLDTSLLITDSTSLCLNGYVLKGRGASSVIKVINGSLILYDCRDGDENVNNEINNVSYSSGVITDGYGTYEDGTYWGAGIYVYKGSFTMNGGTIAGNKNSSSNGIVGGGVFLLNSSFIMNDGLIADNIATIGAGICASDSSFTMNDGEISNNVASHSTIETIGGGIAFVTVTFVMNGGIITKNSAYSAGGLYLSGTSASMNGGTISNNFSSSSDDNFQLYYGADFIMTDGFLSETLYNYSSSISIVGGYFSTEAFDSVRSYIPDGYIGLKTKKYDDYPYEVMYLETHSHDDIVFDNVLFSEGGELSENFYLAIDTDLENDLVIVGDVALCLNGYILKGTGSDSVIKIGSGSSLTLYDCKDGEANNVLDSENSFNSGVITGGDSASGGGIYVEGSLNIFGGAIVGNTSSYGGGIYISNGSFKMYGGTISNNIASVNGDSIYVYGNDNECTISSGYFDGSLVSENASISITGGCFSQSAYESVTLSSEYIFVDLSDKNPENFSYYNEKFPHVIFSYKNPNYYIESIITCSTDYVIPIEGLVDVIPTFFYSNDESSGYGLPQEIGTYKVIATFSEYIDYENMIYFPGTTVEFDLEIINHDFLEEWNYDESGHWYDCANECGEISSYSEHVLGDNISNGSSGHHQECACGYETSQVAHTYSEWVTIKEPTSEETGTQTRACTLCGYTNTRTLGTISATDELDNNLTIVIVISVVAGLVLVGAIISIIVYVKKRKTRYKN